MPSQRSQASLRFLATSSIMLPSRFDSSSSQLLPGSGEAPGSVKASSEANGTVESVLVVPRLTLRALYAGALWSAGEIVVCTVTWLRRRTTGQPFCSCVRR